MRPSLNGLAWPNWRSQVYFIQVKQQLENLYTGQYDPSKRKKKQRQFDKVWAWNVLGNLDAVLYNVCLSL